MYTFSLSCSIDTYWNENYASPISATTTTTTITNRIGGVWNTEKWPMIKNEGRQMTIKGGFKLFNTVLLPFKWKIYMNFSFVIVFCHRHRHRIIPARTWVRWARGGETAPEEMNISDLLTSFFHFHFSPSTTIFQYHRRKMCAPLNATTSKQFRYFTVLSKHIHRLPTFVCLHHSGT